MGDTQPQNVTGLGIPNTTGVATQGLGIRGLTFGEKAVGLSFNPSGDPKVQQIKEACAQLIDILQVERLSASGPEQARLYSIAITEIQTAQMYGVKAVTWKD